MSIVAFLLQNIFVLTLNICLNMSFYILATDTRQIWWKHDEEMLEPDTFLWFQLRHFENDPGTDTVNFTANMAFSLK